MGGFQPPPPTWSRVAPAQADRFQGRIDTSLILLDGRPVPGCDGQEAFACGLSRSPTWHEGRLVADVSLVALLTTLPVAEVQRYLPRIPRSPPLAPAREYPLLRLLLSNCSEQVLIDGARSLLKTHGPFRSSFPWICLQAFALLRRADAAGMSAPVVPAGWLEPTVTGRHVLFLSELARVLAATGSPDAASSVLETARRAARSADDCAWLAIAAYDLGESASDLREQALETAVERAWTFHHRLIVATAHLECGTPGPRVEMLLRLAEEAATSPSHLLSLASLRAAWTDDHGGVDRCVRRASVLTREPDDGIRLAAFHLHCRGDPKAAEEILSAIVHPSPAKTRRSGIRTVPAPACSDLAAMTERAAELRLPHPWIEQFCALAIKRAATLSDHILCATLTAWHRGNSATGVDLLSGMEMNQASYAEALAAAELAWTIDQETFLEHALRRAREAAISPLQRMHTADARILLKAEGSDLRQIIESDDHLRFAPDDLITLARLLQDHDVHRASAYSLVEKGQIGYSKCTWKAINFHWRVRGDDADFRNLLESALADIKKTREVDDAVRFLTKERGEGNPAAALVRSFTAARNWDAGYEMDFIPLARIWATLLRDRGEAEVCLEEALYGSKVAERFEVAVAWETILRDRTKADDLVRQFGRKVETCWDHLALAEALIEVREDIEGADKHVRTAQDLGFHGFDIHQALRLFVQKFRQPERAEALIKHLVENGTDAFVLAGIVPIVVDLGLNRQLALDLLHAAEVKAKDAFDFREIAESWRESIGDLARARTAVELGCVCDGPSYDLACLLEELAVRFRDPDAARRFASRIEASHDNTVYYKDLATFWATILGDTAKAAELLRRAEMKASFPIIWREIFSGWNCCFPGNREEHEACIRRALDLQVCDPDDLEVGAPDHREVIRFLALEVFDWDLVESVIPPPA